MELKLSYHIIPLYWRIKWKRKWKMKWKLGNIGIKELKLSYHDRI